MGRNTRGRFRWTALLVVVAALVAVGCGDDDSDFGAVELAFPLDRADHLAHAALPKRNELPGTGWEVTERDQFSSSTRGEREAEQAVFDEEPSCRALSGLPGFSGGAGNSAPAVARAQVEFKRPGQGLLTAPSSIEVQLTVGPTAVEVQAASATIKSLFSSDEWSRCFAKVVERTAAPQSARGTTVTLKTEPKPASTTAPQDGVGFAFDFSAQTSLIKISASLEMYLWSYSNVSVMVLVGGGRGDLTAEDIAATLRAVDEAVRTADEREPESLPTIALPPR